MAEIQGLRLYLEHLFYQRFRLLNYEAIRHKDQ